MVYLFSELMKREGLRFIPLLEPRALQIFGQSFLKNTDNNIRREYIKIFKSWKRILQKKTLDTISSRLKIPDLDKILFNRDNSGNANYTPNVQYQQRNFQHNGIVKNNQYSHLVQPLAQTEIYQKGMDERYMHGHYGNKQNNFVRGDNNSALIYSQNSDFRSNLLQRNNSLNYHIKAEFADYNHNYSQNNEVCYSQREAKTDLMMEPKRYQNLYEQMHGLMPMISEVAHQGKALGIDIKNYRNFSQPLQNPPPCINSSFRKEN